ncbi:MAG: pyrroline-5-carboxylate reductase [Candidatus Omnitrophota bacterium]
MNIGVIGGGNMGTAILSRVCRNHNVVLCEADRRRASRLRRKYGITLGNVTSAARNADVLLLAVKPQDMGAVLTGLSGCLGNRTIVLSIAAGLTTRYFEKRLGENPRIIRAMPNMPAQIGEGMTALAAGRYATRRDIVKAKTILSAIGEVVEVPEKQMDAVTALSGSGPAYVFLIAECLTGAGRAMGLDEDLSRRLAEQTLKGSACQLAELKDDAGTLRRKVTSRGGTTQAALKVFAAEGIGGLFKKALKAARRRSRELAKT